MRILLLEDNKATQRLIQARLIQAGHKVDIVDNGHQGFLLVTSNYYDVILSDIRMPHWDGFKFLEAIQVVRPKLPVIIITGNYNEVEIKEKLSRHPNVVQVLPKPFDFNLLFETLHRMPTQSHDRLNKMARIVATIGPSSATSEVLGKMILAGMDVVRLNFSHGSHDQHKKALEEVRKAEKLWEKPIAVMVDLTGPKIRTGPMENGQISLAQGDKITIQAEPIEGTAQCISTISPQILPDVKAGNSILLDDGLLEFRVVEEGEEKITCEVVIGGILKSNKGMNLPNTDLTLPSVTKKDWHDLDWAIANDVEYVALSFVRSPEEVIGIKNYIKESTNPALRVIAKIEKPEAVTHISEIVQVSDAIMIARGDMGVELPASRVPRIQQNIIKLCWEKNTPVITATQMLDSMTLNSRPTRAEVTDVSVAIKEGTDAVMLSQETATGVDPVNVIRTMASIICEEEKHAKLGGDYYKKLFQAKGINPVLTAAASLNSNKATILLDPDGTLYPALSKWNRMVPSIIITKSKQIARHASLYKNIVPLIITDDLNQSDLITKAIELTTEEGYIKKGDIVAVVEGKYLERGFDQIGSLQLITV